MNTKTFADSALNNFRSNNFTITPLVEDLYLAEENLSYVNYQDKKGYIPLEDLEQYKKHVQYMVEFVTQHNQFEAFLFYSCLLEEVEKA